MDGVASSVYLQDVPYTNFTVFQMWDRSPQHSLGNRTCAATTGHEAVQYFAVKLQREVPVNGISVLNRDDCDECG